MFILKFISKRQPLKAMNLFWCTSGIFLNYVVLVVFASDSKVYPVYSNQRVRSMNNSAMDLVVGTVYKVRSMEPQIQSRGNEEVFLDASTTKAEEDVYLVGQRELCKRNVISSCWTYNGLVFVKNFLQPLPPGKTLGRSLGDKDNDVPHLVGLPIQGNGTYSLLGRSSIWGFGDMYSFLERQASRFIQGHGILFPASSWEDAVSENFQQPVIMNEETTKDLQDARGKVKRKSILFPLLVLFKFFKIKMVLVPILLTVLMVKKLLIITLALAPNLMGFFRVCRPPFTPPFGLAPAGLLQDVTDSRGEFSSIYNTYASPYRDMHGYRNRDFGRYVSEAPRQPGTADATQTDY